MNQELLLETEKLVRSWARHEAGWLADYLVAGVSDPRLNIPSILSRHFLIRELFKDRFEALMTHEYRFAATIEWLLSSARQAADSESFAAILDALRKNSDNAEGMEIPRFVLQNFGALPAQAGGWIVPNYIEVLLREAVPADAPFQRAEPALNTFARIWSSALGSPPAVSSLQPAASLVEPACGSANDYRFLHNYGLAPFLEYTGFDLCQKNIDNARALFPGIHFEPGNAFEIHSPDKTFDFCIIHDLFEHLSLAGLEQSVGEVCRVTRRGISVGFFQMDEIPEHIVRPLDEYHWNLLSVGRMKELFARHGFAAQAIHIGSFLSRCTGCRHTHNPNAYTFFLEPQAG